MPGTRGRGYVAGVIFSYNGSKFPNCQVEPRISVLPNFNAAQVPWSHVVRWDLTIWLMNPTASQTVMKTLIANVQRIFSVNGGDVILYEPDGVTRSQHQLLSRDTLGGTIVVQQPQFPDARGAEHVTYRTCQVAIAATIPVAITTDLREMRESLSFEGGGIRTGHLEPVVGYPVKQTKKQNTIYRATQSGFAIGNYGYPTAALPIWPDALTEKPRIDLNGGERIGNALTGFVTSWHMTYESASVLVGTPTPWLL